MLLVYLLETWSSSFPAFSARSKSRWCKRLSQTVLSSQSDVSKWWFQRQCWYIGGVQEMPTSLDNGNIILLTWGQVGNIYELLVRFNMLELSSFRCQIESQSAADFYFNFENLLEIFILLHHCTQCGKCICARMRIYYIRHVGLETLPPNKWLQTIIIMNQQINLQHTTNSDQQTANGRQWAAATSIATVTAITTMKCYCRMFIIQQCCVHKLNKNHTSISQWNLQSIISPQVKDDKREKYE